VTDVLDLAQRHEEMRRDIALGGVLCQARQLDTPRAEFLCVDCADPIEPERREACPGAVRCLVCQEAREAHQRLFPRGPR
jgi:RNA polymerase-binding transcription factor DksA